MATRRHPAVGCCAKAESGFRSVSTPAPGPVEPPASQSLPGTMPGGRQPAISQNLLSPAAADGYCRATTSISNRASLGNPAT
jgi:hypothetical protein